MSTFEGPLRPGTSPRKPSDRFEGPLKPGKIRVPRQPITNPRDLLDGQGNLRREVISKNPTKRPKNGPKAAKKRPKSA